MSSTKTGFRCELLDWDSRHFGFGIARVHINALGEEEAAGVDAWCAENDVRCLYLFADPGDAETSRAAAQHGFREVDLRLTARRSLDEEPPAGSEEVEVREATDEQLDYLRSLASTSYRGESRFYLDGGFPGDRCDALYAAWVDRGFDDSERMITAATLDGEPVGFQVVGPRGTDGARRLELVAVDPRVRGAGVGAALISGTMRRMRDEGAPEAWTILSARNLATVRLHEGLGFLTEKADVCHHKWYGGR
jgi:GNAT superfamily N-acetyltransferase